MNGIGIEVAVLGGCKDTFGTVVSRAENLDPSGNVVRYEYSRINRLIGTLFVTMAARCSVCSAVKRCVLKL